MSSTVPVTFTVTELRRLHRAGNLLALATVEVDLDGVALTLHGVQVLRLPTGRLQCRAPHYRAQIGAWVPAVTLPDELEVAIGRDPRRVHCMRLTRTSGGRSRLKEPRSIATRYGKTATSYAAGIAIAALSIGLNLCADQYSNANRCYSVQMYTNINLPIQ
jgi:hypothetical protein